MPDSPTFIEEEKLWQQGFKLIAGIDEVGRGPLAGPVVAAAVILSPENNHSWLEQVRDSKKLSAKKRGFLSSCIREKCIAFGIGEVSPVEIDLLGIVGATKLAMSTAVEQLTITPDALLIDAMELPGITIRQKSIIKGDNISRSIAAASIVAKVYRDGLMTKYDKLYPEYGFARNMGYGTKEHMNKLREIGSCPIHRTSFAPVRGTSKSNDRKRTGALGENAATEHLIKQGYTILQRNYRCPVGEIDIIARDGDSLVFVEVRTKRSRQFGTPEESITPAKKAKLIELAETYLQEHGKPDQHWRIDVVAVEIRQGDRVSRIELIRNAVT